MDNIVLLAICFAIGVVLRRCSRFPANGHVGLNAFTIHISLPALTLASVHTLTLDRMLILPASMAWVMF